VWRDAEKVAEQLVSPIDKEDLHGCQSCIPSSLPPFTVNP
jgi:hypothetical protein